MEVFDLHIPFLEKTSQRKSLEGNYKEQPKIAIDGTEDTVCTVDNRILHGKLISTPLKFPRSAKEVCDRTNPNCGGPAEEV